MEKRIKEMLKSGFSSSQIQKVLHVCDRTVAKVKKTLEKK